MMQKMGKSEQTKDEVYTEFVVNFNKQQVGVAIHTCTVHSNCLHVCLTEFLVVKYYGLSNDVQYMCVFMCVCVCV